MDGIKILECFLITCRLIELTINYRLLYVVTDYIISKCNYFFFYLTVLDHKQRFLPGNNPERRKSALFQRGPPLLLDTICPKPAGPSLKVPFCQTLMGHRFPGHEQFCTRALLASMPAFSSLKKKQNLWNRSLHCTVSLRSRHARTNRIPCSNRGGRVCRGAKRQSHRDDGVNIRSSARETVRSPRTNRHDLDICRLVAVKQRP